MTVQIDMPADLYAFVSKRAEANGTTIAAEVIAALEAREEDLELRERFYQGVQRIQAMHPRNPMPGPSAEEMLREDRER